MSTTLQNSIWPNAGGTLGEIKAQIPDGVTIKWPEGDALVGNFVYKDGKLVGLVDTKALTVNDSGSTTFPYDYVNIQVDKSLEGVMTFNKGERTKYLTITYNESGNDSVNFVIIDFNTTDQETIDAVRPAKKVVNNKLYGVDDNLIGTLDTSKIEVGGILDEETNAGDGLFCNIDATTMEERGIVLSEFNSDLSSLEDGTYMFYVCINLTTVSSDLSNLTNGYNMFGWCTALTSFTSDLSSLTNGECMFYYCSALTSFSSDLSSLTNGYGMFSDCFNLNSFTSDLSSLTNGVMFNNCKLDASSVKNIIDTINTYSGDLILGMGCNDITEDKELFAQEVGYGDMTALLATLEAKGWNVTAQFNGRPTTTYDLRRTSENILPVFVKLEETQEYANYTSEDGSKKFKLNWFHETTGSTNGYTQFNSLEEAIEMLNIKPIERS